jgi:hypothetical protein
MELRRFTMLRRSARGRDSLATTAKLAGMIPRARV